MDKSYEEMKVEQIYMVTEGTHEDEIFMGVFDTWEKAYNYFKLLPIKDDKRIVKFHLNVEGDIGETIIDE